MNILSDISLYCFLEDFRILMLYFGQSIPEYMDFVSLAALYRHFKGIDEKKLSILEDITELLEPYIPMIINEKSLQNMLLAYSVGDSDEIYRIENEYLNRSKFIFANSIMKADENDWKSIVTMCLKIKSLRTEK